MTSRILAETTPAILNLERQIVINIASLAAAKIDNGYTFAADIVAECNRIKGMIDSLRHLGFMTTYCYDLSSAFQRAMFSESLLNKTPGAPSVEEQNRLNWESEAALRRSEERGMNQQYRATADNE